MLQKVPDNRSLPAHRHRSRSIASRAWALWLGYLERRAIQATFHVLSGLDDRMLKDIGIERSELELLSRSMTDGSWRRYQHRRLE